MTFVAFLPQITENCSKWTFADLHRPSRSHPLLLSQGLTPQEVPFLQRDEVGSLGNTLLRPRWWMTARRLMYIFSASADLQCFEADV